jgi:hypothetical protein
MFTFAGAESVRARIAARTSQRRSLGVREARPPARSAKHVSELSDAARAQPAEHGSMNQTPLAVGGEAGEGSRPTLGSPPGTAANPVVAGRDEDLLGVRRKRDLARISYRAGHDFGHVPARSPEEAE